MNNLEKRICKILGNADKYDDVKARILTKETVHMFDKRLNIALTIAWVTIVIAAIIELLGFVGLALGLAGKFGTRLMIFCGVIALSGGQFHLLAKLWYWVYHSQIKVRQELKQLQLQIAELGGKDSVAEKQSP